MPARPAARSLSQAPPASEQTPPAAATPALTAPPPLAQVFDVRPANVTAVSTAPELAQAMRQGALDIEIRAHLDLTPLLESVTGAGAEDDAEIQLDALALFMVDINTRSIRGNCSDPDASQALQLPQPEPGDAPLLPLRPFQCLLLLPDTFIAVQRNRLWLDNLYLRHHINSRALPSLQRVPSFVALGRELPNSAFSDYSLRNDDPEMTELHATAVTFQGHSTHSVHAVRSAGSGTSTAVFLRDCIITDWGGRAPPLEITTWSSASITDTVFRNMRQRAELVDVSFNGLVQFRNVSLADTPVPPQGRIVSTSMNDYLTSPATDSVGVYYAADDENYDVDVEAVPDGAGGVFGADHAIASALMSDCLFQYYEEGDDTPQPGCPPASVAKRAAVAARMSNNTAGTLGTTADLYYDPPADSGGGVSIGGGIPFAELDYLYAKPPEPDYEFVGAPGAAPVGEAPGAAAGAPLTGQPFADYAGGAPFVATGDYEYGEYYGEYAPAPGGEATYIYGQGSIEYDTQYMYGAYKPDIAGRLDNLQEEDPWFAGIQRVLPKRPPPPPDWPPLTAPPDAAADVPRSSAELAQPFSSADAAAQLAPGAADNSDDNTAATAIAVAVFVAAVLAIALCAAAAIARQRRHAQEAEKGSEAAAAGGMMAGGAVGGAKPRDEGARQVAKLSRQLDLFNEDDLFMGQYEVLGRDRSSLGSNTFVQHVLDSDSGRPYAVKFFFSPDLFATEATFYAAFQPYLRGTLGPTLAAAAEEAADAAPPSAPPGGEFLPRVHALLDTEAGGLVDPSGRPLPPCIVMDKGLSLQDWSDRSPPDLFTALAMLSAVSKRLASLHAAGYVHGDLKPSKVMLTAIDNRWTVGGFSRAARAGTRSPMRFTLAYAAPEVVAAFARGEETLECVAARDAWALGVLAYELLTGAPAFKILTEGQSKAVAQLKGEQELPWEDAETAAAALRKLGMLRGAVLQLLHRDPTQRATARQFHTACSQAFAEGAVPAV